MLNSIVLEHGPSSEKQCHCCTSCKRKRAFTAHRQNQCYIATVSLQNKIVIFWRSSCLQSCPGHQSQRGLAYLLLVNHDRQVWISTCSLSHCAVAAPGQPFSASDAIKEIQTMNRKFQILPCPSRSATTDISLHATSTSLALLVIDGTKMRTETLHSLNNNPGQCLW